MSTASIIQQIDQEIARLQMARSYLTVELDNKRRGRPRKLILSWY